MRLKLARSRHRRCRQQIISSSIGGTNKLEEEKQEHARQAYQLYKNIQPIPGSADDDNREIQEANDIRRRMISVIQNSLGSL